MRHSRVATVPVAGVSTGRRRGRRPVGRGQGRVPVLGLAGRRRLFDASRGRWRRRPGPVRRARRPRCRLRDAGQERRRRIGLDAVTIVTTADGTNGHERRRRFGPRRLADGVRQVSCHQRPGTCLLVGLAQEHPYRRYLSQTIVLQYIFIIALSRSVS